MPNAMPNMLCYYNMPKFTKMLYLDSFNGRNITSPYEKSGIWRFNKLIFNDAPDEVNYWNAVKNPNKDTGGDELAITGDELAIVGAKLGDV